MRLLPQPEALRQSRLGWSDLLVTLAVLTLIGLIAREQLLGALALPRAAVGGRGAPAMTGRVLAGLARALMARPKLLLLDEPSLGLAPLIVKQIFEAIRDLNRKEGLSVFLVEQNAFHALKLAHRAYVMVNGLITMSGTGEELLKRPEVRAAYLEGGAH
jgi:ABC-type branched-subunit amino acid transport system ATPase component